MKRLLRWFGIGLLLAACSSQAQVKSNAPQDPKAARQEFSEHINAYLAMQKEMPEKKPSRQQSASPEKIEGSREQLAERIRANRADAKQGDIFTPAVTAMLRDMLRQAMKGTKGAKIRTSLRHAEPVKPLPLKVNESYPENLPKQSMPPSLLMALPQLPRELDYRIVGRDLVLHDVNADLVVDIIPNALP